MSFELLLICWYTSLVCAYCNVCHVPTAPLWQRLINAEMPRLAYSWFITWMLRSISSMTALFASSLISSAFVFWHAYIKKKLRRIQSKLLFFWSLMYLLLVTSPSQALACWRSDVIFKWMQPTTISIGSSTSSLV